MARSLQARSDCRGRPVIVGAVIQGMQLALGSFARFVASLNRDFRAAFRRFLDGGGGFAYRRRRNSLRNGHHHQPHHTAEHDERSLHRGSMFCRWCPHVSSQRNNSMFLAFSPFRRLVQSYIGRCSGLILSRRRINRTYSDSIEADASTAVTLSRPPCSSARRINMSQAACGDAWLLSTAAISSSSTMSVSPSLQSRI